MKIYLAATYGSMEKMREAATVLEASGHEITAQWIYGKEENQTDEAGALMDIADVDRCDTVLAFSLPRETPATGGGRHFEYGYGYARGKRIVIIGPRGEHIFHFLPGIAQYDTVEKFLEHG